jgi:hypothetical protein
MYWYNSPQKCTGTLSGGDKMYRYIFPPKMYWYTFDLLWKCMRLQMHHSLPPLSLSCMYLPGHWLASLLAQHASRNLAFDSRSLKAKAYNFTSNLHLTSFYLLTNVITLSLSRMVTHCYNSSTQTESKIDYPRSNSLIARDDGNNGKYK